MLQCREVYHTKRMQHVICVKWSSDNKYILSGSDEMNIRLWKANAAEKLGVVSVTFFCFFFLPSKRIQNLSPTFDPSSPERAVGSSSAFPIFGLTWLRIEPTTYQNQGRHLTAEVVLNTLFTGHSESGISQHCNIVSLSSWPFASVLPGWFNIWFSVGLNDIFDLWLLAMITRYDKKIFPAAKAVTWREFWSHDSGAAWCKDK